MAALLVPALLLVAPLSTGGGRDGTLAELLAHAVDLPTPTERAEAAAELAAREDVTLEEWLDAARAFAPLESELTEPGMHAVTVPLHVLGATESTTRHFFVPSSWNRDDACPLLVVLHGAGGDGRQMVPSYRSTAEALGAVVLAPTESGANVGYTAEPRERAAVLEAIRFARRRFDVDEDRVYVTGFSRGGHLTYDLALRRPDLFAAAAPLAGGPRLVPERGQASIRFAPNLVGLPLRAVVGELDDAAMLWNVRDLVRRAREEGAESVEFEVLPGTGHSFDPEACTDWAAWFGARTRDAEPSEVVRASVREDEARRSWLRVTSFTKEVEEDFRPTIQVRAGKQPDEDELREAVADATCERTAVVHARFVEPGRFRVEAIGADEVELLLTTERLGDVDAKKPVVRVHDGRRERRVAVEIGADVLLGEFVERFDRRFLPVARVRTAVAPKRR
ncbi:MAG: prolyl oligopeptidase family serine peptidase [Planctomycetota bacterium]